ncbi:MAG: hypothetical protein ACREMR_12015 [Gemmatimonadales bacterium]
MSDSLVALVAVVLLFGGVTLFLLAISPIGKAIASRILGRRSPMVGGDDITEQLKELRHDVDALRAAGGLEELEHVRRELAELAERLDFAERVLAKQREADRLAPPRASP